MGKKVYAAFSIPTPIDELSATSTLLPGWMLLEDENGKSWKIATSAFYQMLNNFARPISPSDAGPFTANSWYKPTISSDSPGTNYPHAGSLKAKRGFDTLFWYNGTTWVKAEVELPVPVTNNFITNNTYNIDPSQIVPTEALYPDDTLAATITKRISYVNTDVNYKETTQYYDGSVMNDSKCDGFIYIKSNDKYYVQVFEPRIDVRLLGVIPNGIDMTEALNRALQILVNGAVLIFSPHEYRFDGKINIPHVDFNTGLDIVPMSKPFSFIGSGMAMRVKSSAPLFKGTTFKMNYTGNGSLEDAKIVSLGCSKFTMEGITFETTINHITPFYYTNYTTSVIRNNMFVNSSGFDGTAALIHCLVFGGTEEDESGSDINNGFQGFASDISNNAFCSIGVAVHGRRFFNANYIANNWVDHNCGHATLAPFILDNPSGIQYVVGNTFIGNSIEQIGYKYSAIFKKARANNWISNGSYDESIPTSPAIATVLLDSDCYYNTFIWSMSNAPAQMEGNNGTNVIIYGDESKFNKVSVNSIKAITDSPDVSNSLHQKDSLNRGFLIRAFNEGRDLRFKNTYPNPLDPNDILEVEFLKMSGHELQFNNNVPASISANNNLSVFAKPNTEFQFGEANKNWYCYLGALGFPEANPGGYIRNGSLYIDTNDGKLKFRDRNGVDNTLY